MARRPFLMGFPGFRSRSIACGNPPTAGPSNPCRACLRKVPSDRKSPFGCYTVRPCYAFFFNLDRKIFFLRSNICKKGVLRGMLLNVSQHA
jgi:hypothetical protein